MFKDTKRSIHPPGMYFIHIRRPRRDVFTFPKESFLVGLFSKELFVISLHPFLRTSLLPRNLLFGAWHRIHANLYSNICESPLRNLVLQLDHRSWPSDNTLLRWSSPTKKKRTCVTKLSHVTSDRQLVSIFWLAFFFKSARRLKIWRRGPSIIIPLLPPQSCQPLPSSQSFS